MLMVGMQVSDQPAARCIKFTAREAWSQPEDLS
jgi:hypothetical protein